MSELERSNRRILVSCLMAAGLMLGAAYAAVPLYDLFCRVTGYGGTPQIGAAAAGKLTPADMHAPQPVIRVRFDANLHRDMPWVFTPPQGMELPMGEMAFAYYRAHNPTDEPVVGIASFNVEPQKAATYFNKLACFCFEKHTLAPGASLDMPVTFFVDPALHEDAAMDDVREFVLSYTFFMAPAEAADARFMAPAEAADARFVAPAEASAARSERDS